MFEKKKHENQEEVMRHQEQTIPKPPQPPIQPPVRTFLLKLADAESEENIVVKGINILDALHKFVVKYKGECDEWIGLALSIEEVETIA